MFSFLSFVLYSVVTFLITILLFPVVFVSDVIGLFQKPNEMTEREFIADLYNP